MLNPFVLGGALEAGIDFEVAVSQTKGSADEKKRRRPPSPRLKQKNTLHPKKLPNF